MEKAKNDGDRKVEECKENLSQRDGQSPFANALEQYHSGETKSNVSPGDVEGFILTRHVSDQRKEELAIEMNYLKCTSEGSSTQDHCRLHFEKTPEHHAYHKYINDWVNDTRPSAWIKIQLSECGPSAMYNFLKRCRNNPMFKGFYQEDFAYAIKYARQKLQFTLNPEQASVELNSMDVSNEVLNGYTWVDCLMCLLSVPLYVPTKQRLDTTPPTNFADEVREKIKNAHPKIMEKKRMKDTYKSEISVDDITKATKCLWQVKQREEKQHYQKLVPVHGLAYRDTPAGYKAILDIGKCLIRDKKVVKSMQSVLSILHTLLNDPKYYAEQLNFTGTTAASYEKRRKQAVTDLQNEREKMGGQSVKAINRLKSISDFFSKQTKQWTAEHENATARLKKAELEINKFAPSIWIELMQQKRWFSAATTEVEKNPVMALSFIYALFSFGYNSNPKDMKNLFMTHRFGFHSEDWSTHTNKFLTMFFAIHLDSESETNKKSLIVEKRDVCKFAVCFVCFFDTCGTCGSLVVYLWHLWHKKINHFSPSPP